MTKIKLIVSLLKKVKKLISNIIEYFKYSGLTFTIIFNPFHWDFIPSMSDICDELTNETMGGTTFSFLFIRISCWFDNGDW
jgi:hypothetical protein